MSLRVYRDDSLSNRDTIYINTNPNRNPKHNRLENSLEQIQLSVCVAENIILPTVRFRVWV